jgi:hypothetical protein
MILTTALVLMVHTGADAEEAIAALCLFATVAHALGEMSRRDDAVDAAAELSTTLARPGGNRIGVSLLS